MFAVVNEQAELTRLFDEFKREMTAAQWDFSTYNVGASNLDHFCGCFAGYVKLKNASYSTDYVDYYWKNSLNNLDPSFEILEKVLVHNNVLENDCSLSEFIKYFEVFLKGLNYIIDNNIDNPDRYSRQLSDYIRLFTQDAGILTMPYPYDLADLHDFYVDYYKYQEYLTDNNQYHMFDNYYLDGEYTFHVITPTSQKQSLIRYKLIDEFNLNKINWSVIKYED